MSGRARSSECVWAKTSVVEWLRSQHGEVRTGSSWGSFANEPNLRSEFQASKRPGRKHGEWCWGMIPDTDLWPLHIRIYMCMQILIHWIYTRSHMQTGWEKDSQPDTHTYTLSLPCSRLYQQGCIQRNNSNKIQSKTERLTCGNICYEERKQGRIITWTEHMQIYKKSYTWVHLYIEYVVHV